MIAALIENGKILPRSTSCIISERAICLNDIVLYHVTRQYVPTISIINSFAWQVKDPIAIKNVEANSHSACIYKVCPDIRVFMLCVFNAVNINLI